MVDELAKLPSLVKLSCRGNRLVSSDGNLQTAKQLFVARLGQVVVLNRSTVQPEERRGAELDYIKMFGEEWLKAGGRSQLSDEFTRRHPRYVSLIESKPHPQVTNACTGQGVCGIYSEELMIINLRLVTCCRVWSSRRRRAEEVDANSSEESAAKLVPPSSLIGQTSSRSDSMLSFQRSSLCFLVMLSRSPLRRNSQVASLNFS